MGQPDGCPVADIVVSDPRLYGQVASAGSLGLAEAYLRGYWHSQDLTRLLATLYRKQPPRDERWSAIAPAAGLARRAWHWLRRNTVAQSRRNIAAHYDLSNEFFALFLDPTLMYSSAYFKTGADSLEHASLAKLELICNRLDLQAGDEVLEIGTGWGGFAEHAAALHDIRLTSTTISPSQYQVAKQRVEAAGLAERVQLVQQDYRELEGSYDKIVSIEMIEAVGEKYLPKYFDTCNRRLRPGGRLVLQAIVMPEQRYQDYRRGVDFIQRYIFPGGFLPSVTAMQDAVARTSDLRLTEVFDMSSHYAKTLQHWRHNFMAQLDEVRRLGFDERFIRMWEFYLCYCEAAFQEQAVRVVQIAWEKPQ